MMTAPDPRLPGRRPRPSSDLSAMVLARIRQLSAHEVGHTLGFAHNFAASTYDRGSVMDYPAPLVKIQDGKLDLSDAYARGIGKYDEFATKFAYAQFPPGSDEAKELNEGRRGGPRRRPAVPLRRRRPARRRRAPAGEPLGQRRRPRRHAPPRDGGPADRPGELRPGEPRRGGAAVGPRGEAPAALPPPPLPAPRPPPRPSAGSSTPTP